MYIVYMNKSRVKIKGHGIAGARRELLDGDPQIKFQGSQVWVKFQRSAVSGCPQSQEFTLGPRDVKGTRPDR